MIPVIAVGVGVGVLLTTFKLGLDKAKTKEEAEARAIAEEPVNTAIAEAHINIADKDFIKAIDPNLKSADIKKFLKENDADTVQAVMKSAIVEQVLTDTDLVKKVRAKTDAAEMRDIAFTAAQAVIAQAQAKASEIRAAAKAYAEMNAAIAEGNAQADARSDAANAARVKASDAKAQTDDAKAKPDVCPQCGKPVKPDANFCGECGGKLKT